MTGRRARSYNCLGRGPWAFSAESAIVKPIGMHHRMSQPTAMRIVERFDGLLPCSFVDAALAAAIPTSGIAPMASKDTLPVPAIRS